MSAELGFHPLADVFPLLEGEAFDTLIADIKARGLLLSITLYEGQILDGRNRWRACRVLGIDPKREEYTGTDPGAWVWSMNAERRQLTVSQRAIAKAKLLKLTHGGYRHGLADRSTVESQVLPGGLENDHEKTIKEAAKEASIGHSSLERAKRILQEGTEEMIKAVESGKLTVKAAHKQLAVSKPAKAVSDTNPAGRSLRLKNGPGRGHVGPKVSMVRQMQVTSSGAYKYRTQFWKDNQEVISSLPNDLLCAFLKELTDIRATHSQLIQLLRENGVS